MQVRRYEWQSMEEKSEENELAQGPSGECRVEVVSEQEDDDESTGRSSRWLLFDWPQFLLLSPPDTLIMSILPTDGERVFKKVSEHRPEGGRQTLCSNACQLLLEPLSLCPHPVPHVRETDL